MAKRSVCNGPPEVHRELVPPYFKRLDCHRTAAPCACEEMAEPSRALQDSPLAGDKPVITLRQHPPNHHFQELAARRARASISSGFVGRHRGAEMFSQHSGMVAAGEGDVASSR